MPTKDHVVRQGECALSIAARYGFTWERIWDDPANAELKEARNHANILLAGDILVIPELTLGEEDGDTEATHRFRKLNTPIEIRVRVEDHEGPRANEPYHVEIGRRVFEGETETTDGEGLAICHIPADARRAMLVVGEREDEYELQVGAMDPSDTVTGVHARLENMGFDPGDIDSGYDADSVHAMEEFLKSRDVDPEGRTTTKHDNQDNRDDLVDEYSI